jgi:hypothetical protein
MIRQFAGGDFMFGSEMLDVAIGMIFMYLLLSLLCSAINELIEGRLKNRAADLEKGLRELLDDKDGTGLVKQLYEHGMVNGLFKGNYNPAATDKSNLPSYIPSRNFALAILGILVPENPAAGSPVNLRDTVGKISNAKVKNALTAMLTVAGEDVDKLRDNIESWFNSAMDRVSGWYKRRSQLIVFTVGFIAAGAMNVNSISLANDLWVHKAQRDALVTASQGYLGNHAGQIGQDTGLTSNVEEIKKYGLPIGWNIEWHRDQKGWLLFGIWALLGWFLTACAVSLGAPFWFDMLNKLIVVRSTIKPHEKSAEETSKN